MKDPGTRRVNATFGDPYTGTHLVIRLGWIQEVKEKEPTQPQSTTCSSLKEGQGVGGAGRREKSERAKGTITKGTSFQGPYLGNGAFQTVAVLLALVRKRITETAQPSLPLSNESRRLALTPQALVGEGTEKKAASLRGFCNC